MVDYIVQIVNSRSPAHHCGPCDVALFGWLYRREDILINKRFLAVKSNLQEEQLIAFTEIDNIRFFQLHAGQVKIV